MDAYGVEPAGKGRVGDECGQQICLGARQLGPVRRGHVRTPSTTVLIAVSSAWIVASSG